MLRILAFALVASACALVDQAGAGPLVTVEAHGGMCPDAECRSVIAIEADGLVHQLEPDQVEIGRVSAAAVDAYHAALAVTDFAAIRSRPFRGECPTAFDGQELVYRFSTVHGPERIASCEVEVDPQHPLFAAVNAILGRDGS